MADLEQVIKGLWCCNHAGNCSDCPFDIKGGADRDQEGSTCMQNLLGAAYDALKAQEPCEDWISRKQLKDEIQYYIDEAGWGEEVNKALGWCLEFIDNQRAVKWE